MNFEGFESEKSIYRFKEVTSLANVKPYVLRFWETEFEQIQPELTEAGDKLYSAEDLEVIKTIKNLLFNDKLSIPEAKLALVEALAKKPSLHEDDMMERINSSHAVKATPEISEQTPNNISIEAELEVTHDAIFAENVTTKLSSLDMMKAALGRDLSESQKVIYKKEINDQEVLKLVQAKKKLSSVLKKVNQIIEDNNWQV